MNLFEMVDNNNTEILSSITLPSNIPSPSLDSGNDIAFGSSFSRRNLVPVRPSHTKKSPIWKYFAVYPEQSDKEKQEIFTQFAVCLTCYDEYHEDDSLSTASSWEVKYGRWHTTTKLMNHLSSNHRKLYREFLKEKPSAINLSEELDVEDDSCSSSLHRDSCQTSVAGSSKITAHFSNKSTFEEKLVKWIVMRFKTLDEVEHESFREMMEALCPAVHHFSVKTIKDKIISTEVSVRSRLMKHLRGESIAITIDMWSSVSFEGYMALSAVFINKNWELENWTVNCQPFPGKHGAEQVKRKLYELLEEMEISHENIVCCVTDNDATMNSFADTLDFEWQGCLAHLINLVTNFAFRGFFLCVIK